MQLIRVMFLVFALQLGWPPSSGASELVVIVSNDPEFEVGVVLDGNKPVEIAAERSLVLISSAGKVISLSGPYHDIPDPSGPNSGDRLVGSLSQLLGKKANPPTALGATRGLPRRSPAGRPDIWGIDIARAGTYCLRADRPTMLWWAAARSFDVVSLSRTDNNTDSVELRWQRGERALAWPKSLVPVDGATYVARFWADDSGERLTTITMPPLETDAHRAAWMAEHGCTGQALKVLSALGKGEL